MTNRKRKGKAEIQSPDATSQPVSESEPKVPMPRTESTSAGPAAVPKLPSLSRILSVVMLILGILAVGALFYKVMAGFFVPLFLAALLVMLFRPVHEWLYDRFGKRPRLAALATTLLVLVIVLLPLIILISVATSQFTAMVSQVKFDDLSMALDRSRDRLGISLPHAEQFRRLDELTDTFDEPKSPGGTVSDEDLIANITESINLVQFLQNEIPGPGAADKAAADAEAALEAFMSVVQKTEEPSSELIGQLNAEEQFHRQSVIASASIRSWMRVLLGGTLRSQVRLLANPSAEDFKSLLKRGRESLQPRFVSLTSATGTYLIQILVGLVVLVIAVYFFLIDGPAMIHTLMRLSPLDDAYEQRLLVEFDRTSRAVVLASVLSALVQGTLAAVAYFLCGFESVILLFLITTLMSLVPFLGAASVWAPCALYLGAVEERWWPAIFLASYGAIVVSSIDNVIKMYVLQGHSTLHPLFALLSVLGGVKVFGPMGILVGPMVVVFLQTLLEILSHELVRRDAHDTGEPAKNRPLV
jgi:predicted PurR-regulated permease PerM